MKDKKMGCGGLIFIIIIVYGFLNDIASYVGESLQIFMWIGIIIVICAIVKYIHDNLKLNINRKMQC